LGDFIATDHPCPGIQRLRAGFFGHAYDPHRHETYAIGVTERGFQAFRYRGAECVSTTGMTIVLHPDEVHDGHAVAPDGFVCRMLYIDAALIGDALDDRSLPFVADPVSGDPALAAALDEAFEGFPNSFTTLAGAGIVASVADRLSGRAGRPRRRGRRSTTARGSTGRATCSTRPTTCHPPRRTSKPRRASTATPWPAPSARASRPRRTAIWSDAGCSGSRRRSPTDCHSPRPPPQAVSPTKAT
jgi:hypothetical protein